MLSLYPLDVQSLYNRPPHSAYPPSIPSTTPSPTSSSFPPYISMGGGQQPHDDRAASGRTSSSAYKEETPLAQALEIARESADGASDPTVVKILETAINDIWAKVKAEPDTYVMTKLEFAVFNYHQDRFRGEREKLAVAARKRYWDSAKA